MPVPTSGIDHVHATVPDIEALIERMTALLACEHNIPLYIESIQALNSMNSLGLDAFEPLEPEGISARQMARFGPGLNTVSFHVDDIDAATAHIEACGVRSIGEIGYPGVERQTQFHPKDCFGMVLEIAYWEPGHEAIVAEIKAKQAAENGGCTGIPAQPGALPSSGIDHVHLGVGELDAAREWFSRLFLCEWDETRPRHDGVAACESSIGIVLHESRHEPGLGALAFGVPDLEAARARVQALGIGLLEAPEHEPDATLAVDPQCFQGLALELVERPSEPGRPQG